jgi:hypothetical protein
MMSVIGIPLISYFSVGSSAVRLRPDCPLYERNSSVAKLWICERSRTLIVFAPWLVTSSSDLADLAIGMELDGEPLSLVSSNPSRGDSPCVIADEARFSLLVKDRSLVYEPELGLELAGGEGGPVVLVDPPLTSPAICRVTARTAVLGGGVPAGTDVG